MSEATAHDALRALRARGTLYAGGKWFEGDGAELRDVNPSTGELLANIGSASPAQMDRAVAAARGAQPQWSAAGFVRRGEYLIRIADLLEASTEELAEILALEVGKPLAQGRGELAWASGTLRYQADWSRKLSGEILPSDNPDEAIHLLRVSLGVVVAICAWNFPMAMFFRKICPALLAGNTVVLKSSETTPLAALALTAVIEEAELPPGVLNVVSGASDVGSYLVGHPGVDLVSMTGSVAAGKAIMRAAADNLTRVSLELGGKAAAIVWKDADLDIAVPSLVLARHLNSGQVCTCAERFYVHEAVYDEFLERYCAAVRALTVGDPFAESDMGPLVSEAQFDKVTSMVGEALDGGASLAYEPTPPARGGGFWFTPTVLTGVAQSMPLMQREVFGPVSPVLKVSTLDEALRFANDSVYGLSGYVFSSSYDVVMRVTRELDCGEIYVNRTLGEASNAHHAGHKQSGIGGEDGLHGLLRYMAIRSVYHQYPARGVSVV
jgi:lactaldehyde dehydrogenase/glycolaldehyde dehydrogenase